MALNTEYRIRNKESGGKARAVAYILLLVSCLSINILSAQNKKIDSMRNVLKTEKDDSNKVKTLNYITRVLFFMAKYSSADSAGEQALQLAEKLNFKSGKCRAFSLLGMNKGSEGKYDEADKLLTKALDIAKEINSPADIGTIYGDFGVLYKTQSKYAEALKYQMLSLKYCQEAGEKTGLGLAYGNIGVIYKIEGNYPEALKYQFMSMKVAEELKDKRNMALVYGNIGVIYKLIGNYTEALKYQFMCLHLNEEMGNKRSVGMTYGNIGNLYDKMGDRSKALEYDFKALDIAKEQKDKYGLGIIYVNLGSIYYKMDSIQQSLKYFMLGLNISKEMKDENAAANAYMSIGEIYANQKKFNVSKLYLDSALKLSKESGSNELLQYAYGHLYELDSASGDFKTAYIDYRNFIQYGDSLKNEENTKKLVQEQMQYDFDKKEASEKAEQEKKDAIALQENNKQRIIRNSFIAGFLLVLALAFFIFRSYRQKQKANEIIVKQKQEVEKQKDIVEEKQKEILDSIHYAQRIQKALLASDNILAPALKGEVATDYFILFKPRDIVSGDFYWATKSNGRFYLAVCDSTGHGVPGAFMSLLNTSFLNEAINEKNITSPNEVFDHARKRLIENISQDGQQDGMDGVLLRLTPTNKGAMVQYSAAYNTPIVLSQGKVVELEADKMPVGASPKEKEPFVLRSASLQKGDCLYLFTDGYADQFGGDKGKKFKYKQLLQLITDNAQLTMQEQKELLNRTFESWKGNLEQTDDVCVIGIRI